MWWWAISCNAFGSTFECWFFKTECSFDTISLKKKLDSPLNLIERIFLDKDLSKKSSREKNKSEIEKYFCDPRIIYDKKIDILSWLKLNANSYPTLAKIAKDYLAIQSTSVQSERSFSMSGLIVTKLRNQLNLESVKKLQCLNSWFDANIWINK